MKLKLKNISDLVYLHLARLPKRSLLPIVLLFLTFSVYLYWISLQPKISITIGGTTINLLIPNLEARKSRKLVITGENNFYPALQRAIDIQYAELKIRRRTESIAKVESFFQSYGSNMAGYGHILVDQAEACGGNYRILVGIAGSESGLGRINYKVYNPFGYIDGVQYPSYEEALTTLSCKISAQHIAPCAEDLQCLAKRYGGPETDLAHFVEKVRWFMEQV